MVITIIQIGTCLTTSLIPAFLLFLTLTVALVPIYIAPVLPIIIGRIREALDISTQSLWIREYWWDQWYSWVIFGGPAGRWLVGILLGVRELQENEAVVRNREPLIGDSLAHPGIFPLGLALFGCVLCLVALVRIFLPALPCNRSNTNP